MDVKKSSEYCVMLDETKDVSKIEQASLVLRYYKNGEPKESFITFRTLEKMDAASL